MWLEQIDSFSKYFTISTPVEEYKIAQLEEKLKIKFSDDLVVFYSETNGLYDQKSHIDLIWSIERIEYDNLEFRKNSEFAKLYMPFESLLFFSDAGNGDLFAFRVIAGEIRYPDVYVWNHENDSRTWVAPSLKMFLEWWTSGQIAI